MTSTVVSCDLCGSTIERKRHSLLLRKEFDATEDYTVWRIDICQLCAGRITSQIGGEARNQTVKNAFLSVLLHLVSARFKH